MDKRKASYFSILVIFLIAVFTFTAAAQDVIYISEPDLAETPKMPPPHGCAALEHGLSPQPGAPET